MIINLQGVFAAEGEQLPFRDMLNLSEWYVDSFCPVPQPVVIEGMVENRAGVVTLHYTARFLYIAPCDRCTAPTEREMTVAMDYTLVRELHEDNENFLMVENDRLDISELAASDVILSLPTKYLCKEDCAGICPQCGKNLNEGPCTCSHETVDPRLEALKQLLD